MSSTRKIRTSLFPKRRGLLQPTTKRLHPHTRFNKGDVLERLGELLMPKYALINAHTKVRVSVFAPSRRRNMESFINPNLEDSIHGGVFTNHLRGLANALQ
jgi:hypothetical protein